MWLQKEYMNEKNHSSITGFEDFVAQWEARPLVGVVRNKLDVERGPWRYDWRRSNVAAVLPQQVSWLWISVMDLNVVIPRQEMKILLFHQNPYTNLLLSWDLRNFAEFELRKNKTIQIGYRTEAMSKLFASINETPESTVSWIGHVIKIQKSSRIQWLSSNGGGGEEAPVWGKMEETFLKNSITVL